MNTAKFYDFFQPEMCGGAVYIIGCGAIGSTVAETLTRLGITRMFLYDDDLVTDHNIANQMYVHADIGRLKVEALYDHLTAINPYAKDRIVKVNARYTDQNLSGYVFLCVDNIDVRREIAEGNRANVNIKAMFDFRMRLEDAQHYAADWRNREMVDDFIKSMQFTHDEARAATPVSACNLTLSVAPTVRSIVSYGVANFMNFVKTGSIRKQILSYPFHCVLDAFP